MTLRGSLEMRSRRADGDQFPTAHAGAGTEIQNVIRGAHGVFIMFDDDHGVSHVSQPVQRGDQAIVVAAGAGRSKVRPKCKGLRPSPNRFGSPNGCAATRRPKALGAVRASVR